MAILKTARPWNAPQFPPALEPSALKIAHTSTSSLGDLVDRIYTAHAPKPLASQAGPAQPGPAVVPEDAKENLNLGPGGPQIQHPLTRPMIRAWLFEVGVGKLAVRYRTSCWL